MSRKLNLVLLFDIDGTLIKTGGAGKYAMEDTFTELYNVPKGMKTISFAGSTDLGIYDMALKLHDLTIQASEHESIFRKKYLERLALYIKSKPRGQKILPGVVEFLDFLQARDDVFISLVTGNYKEGARIKLEHFNLHHYFTEGAFGCDFADRNLLPPLALERITNMGYQLPPKERIWIIGDTVRDIECARHSGLPSLITFTGFNTRREILKQKPELTLETLEEFPRFLEFIHYTTN